MRAACIHHTVDWCVVCLRVRNKTLQFFAPHIMPWQPRCTKALEYDRYAGLITQRQNSLIIHNPSMENLLVQGSTLPKIRIKSRKASNKSYSELNFVPIVRKRICLTPPPVWSQGFQRSVCLKSYNVQKWKIRFNLWFNTAKNTHDIKKSLK